MNNFLKKKIPSITLADICDFTNLNCSSNFERSTFFNGVNSLSLATNSEITWFSNTKYKDDLTKTNAGACFIREEFKELLPKTTIAIITEKPYRSFAKIAQSFYDIAIPMFDAGISSQSFVHETAVIGNGCNISPFAVISKGVTIKDNVYIGAGTVIHENCKIDNDTYICDHVTISNSHIGKNVYIKPGARIGQSGFGFDMDSLGAIDMPQLGHVIIKDNVQIGSNTCIDRGHPGATVIGQGARIDNLVQIAHNVQVGENSILVAQVGIAGSTKLGKFVVAAGQVGIAGHLIIEDNVQIAAQSGVMRDVSKGEIIAGSPSQHITEWHRQTVALKKLIRGRNRASKN